MTVLILLKSSLQRLRQKQLLGDYRFSSHLTQNYYVHIAFCLEVFYGLSFPTWIRFDGWLIIFQTIRNDDLEEIRELGSGTYGAVYHGKWKGSDVAIKRIKASCFSGRPSERARLVILISDSFSFCLRNC
jgi:hypothetical protein